jgi:hypothetical protein
VSGASGPAAAPQYGTPYPQDEASLNVLTTVVPSVLKRYGWVLVAVSVLTWVITKIVGRGRK